MGNDVTYQIVLFLLCRGCIDCRSAPPSRGRDWSNSHFQHYLASLLHVNISSCREKVGSYAQTYVDLQLCSVRLFDGRVVALNPLIMYELRCVPGPLASRSLRNRSIKAVSYLSSSSFQHHLLNSHALARWPESCTGLKRG